LDNAVLQYNFFPHYYIETKDVYETILCECLNQSKKTVSLFGGKFSRITNQENKQPDVIADTSGYEIDFKMMISEQLKEFQSRTSPIAQELAPGVKSYSYPPSLKKKVVLLWNCCRNIDDNRLKELRNKRDMESKAVTHFFDKVINQDKNILLFIPVFFSTIDKNLCPEDQFKAIFQEISSTTSFIYEFRNKNKSGFDTFIIYAINIPQNKELSFVISKFTSNGLELIDTVRFFSLATTQQLSLDNDCKGVNFKLIE